MRKRALIFAAAVVVVAIVAVTFWPGDREPEYQGKKLHEWLAMQTEHPQEPTNAVIAIGTNAVPFLVKWIDFDPPRWKSRLFDYYPAN